MIEEILQYWRTGGLLMGALAVLSYGIWFTWFRLRYRVQAFIRAPREFEDKLARNLADRSLQENRATYRDAPDALSAVVSQVLQSTADEQKTGEVFDQLQSGIFAALDRDTTLLGAFTAAAPLLGLLGTVIGMVATFNAVSAEFGNTSVQVSSGISKALITTQCGLIVAIPGLFGLAAIRRWMDQARVRLGECRIHLVYLLEAGPSGSST